LLFSHLADGQDKSIAVETWDLAIDPDYSARTAKQLETFVKLKPPNIAFLDNKTIVVSYPDGEGAGQSDIENRTRPYSPTHKFHALIFDVNEGPGKARKFAWEAYSERSQLLPTQDGGFAVRVDNHFMVYSGDYELKREMQPPYYGNKPLPTGEPFFREMFWLGVSQTGKSLAICHVLIGRHDSGGTQFSLYDTKSLKQIGQTSELNKNINGCYSGFNATDNAVFGRVFMFQPEAGTWRLVDPKCINCKASAPEEKDWKLFSFDLFDEAHVLFLYDVLDLDGHELYKILPSSDKGARVAKPDSFSPWPHAANAPRLAYDDGQPTGKQGPQLVQKLYVVDWSQGRKLATIKVEQDRLPVRHGGGFQLERLSLTDFTYALSPDGKKLAVLSLNSIKIYEIP
jgi:hypothetical protein